MTNTKSFQPSEAKKELDQYQKTIKDETDIDVTQRGRTRHKSDLLKIFCYYVREKQGFTYQAIGEYLNRNHATVLHAVKMFKFLYYSDNDFREKAEFFMTRFCVIDGFNREQPYKDELAQLNELASEATRREWLVFIRETPLVKAGLDLVPSEVENESKVLQS